MENRFATQRFMFPLNLKPVGAVSVLPFFNLVAASQSNALLCHICQGRTRQIHSQGKFRMNQRRLLVVYFVLLTMSVTTWAQSSTGSSSSLSVPVGETRATTKGLLGNKKFAEDEDITDAKLKADSGSLSKYSLKVSLSYNGPGVGDLGNKMQPNPDGSVGVFETSLGGSIGARYRFDSKSAISLGSGINALTPFHGTERIDLKTPFVSYDRSDRIGEVQMRNSFGTSVTTVPNYRNLGQIGSLSYDNSLVYNIPGTRLAAGIDTGLNVFVYERSFDKKDAKSTASYALEFFPQVKYNITDKWNAYTSLALRYWNPRRLENGWNLANKVISARTGMGVAITRDIYFAPYLNYYPDDFAWKTTTFSFSTVFSIL